MEDYNESPLKNLSAGLLLTQFTFAAVLVMKGIGTALYNGAGLFDSIFIGGIVSNIWWLSLPMGLLVVSWYWPKILRDILVILVVPVAILLMVSVGWSVSGYVPPKSPLHTNDYHGALAESLKEDLRRARAGDPDYIRAVQHYETATHQSFESYIRETEDAYLRDKEKEQKMLDNANWGVRIVYKLLN